MSEIAKQQFRKLCKKRPDAALSGLRDLDLSVDEALVVAAELASQGIVEGLIAKGANPNFGLPASLVVAIEAGNRSILSTLLEAGADLGTQPFWEDGDHPLLSAALKADTESMTWLCEHGAAQVAAGGWIEEATNTLVKSKRRSASTTLAIMMEGVLPRLETGELIVRGGLLGRAAKRISRLSAKKAQDWTDLAQRLELLADLDDTEEDEIIDLLSGAVESYEACRLVKVVDYVKGGGPRQSRRAGIALLWSVRYRIWRRWAGSDFEPWPDGESLVSELLRLGPDMSVRDDMGRTALMYAIKGCRENLARSFIRLGADPAVREFEEDEGILDFAALSAEKERMGTVARDLLGLTRPNSQGEDPLGP